MSRALLVVLVLAVLGAATLLLTDDEVGPAGGTVVPGSAPRAPIDEDALDLPAGQAGDDVTPLRAKESTAPVGRAVDAGGAPVAAVADAPTEDAGPTRVVSGVVRRLSDGSGLPGLRILVETDGEPVETETLEEPAGTFRLEGVPVGAGELVLVTQGPWSERRVTEAIEPGEDELAGLEFTFDSGFAVAGLVTDEHDTPLPGAVVDADRRNTVVAGAAGRFLLRDIAPRETTESVEIGAVAPWYHRSWENVRVPREVSTVPEVHVRLEGGGALVGTVTAPHGAPVPGAEVRIVYTQTGHHGRTAPEGLEATADAEGRYRMDHVPGGRFVIRAGPTADDGTPLVPAWIPDVVVAVGEETLLDIVLPREAVLEGRVTDAYGSPVPGAEVLLERVLRWDAPDLEGSSSTSSRDLRILSRLVDGAGLTVLYAKEDSATTDEAGHYRFAGLTSGEKQVTATDPEGRRVTARDDTTVSAGHDHTLDLVLATGITLRSRVVDETGAPVAEANVQIDETGASILDGPSTLTDHDGRFELGGLPAERQQLFIHKSGYQAVFLEIDPASPEPSYVLTRSPSVRGRVVDALHEEAITRYTAMVEYGGGAMSNQSVWEDGKFEMDVHEDEPVRLTIRAPGYREEVLEDVLPSATMARPLEIKLTPEEG